MTTDNLETLAKEIIEKNDLYFPKWRTVHKTEAEKHIYWTNALSGEVGELCNGSKKHHRFLAKWAGKNLNREEYKEYASEELADIFIYLVLYTDILGIDFSKAVRDKAEVNWKKRFKVE